MKKIEFAFLHGNFGGTASDPQFRLKIDHWNSFDFMKSYWV